MYSSHNLHAVIRSVSADGASSHALPSYQSSWSQGSPPGSPPTSRTPNSSAVAESRKRERVEDTEEPESRKRTRLEDTEEPDRQRYNNSTALPFLRWGRHFPDVPIPHLLESASPKPPITVANLSELDISNIIPNQMLRHNLNFETHARFRPNYNTQLGRMRKAEARKYWAALEIEITYYMRDGHVRSQISSMIGSTIPERLPKMLAEMKCILITLLQKEQAVVVEQTLDVNLIMQQLQKNACDLVKLGDWLATMLQSSCSPQRDNDVVSATDTLKMAAENADPSLTVDGLEHLFSVFETMKLDAANHQIQSMRPFLIEDGIEFEQNRFTGRPMRGTEVAEARTWFAQCCGSSSARDDDFEACVGSSIDSGQYLVGHAAVESVTNSFNALPTTFALDEDRLAELRHDFGLFSQHTIMLDVATGLLKDLWHRALPRRGIEEAVSRIQQLLHSDVEPPSQLDIALEVYRAVHGPRNDPYHDIEKGELIRSIFDRFNSGMAEKAALRRRLCHELHYHVDQEIKTIARATPLQIHTMYTPTWRPQGQESALTLANMAQRIAHISVLHWRVWGPILYQCLRHDRCCWPAPPTRVPSISTRPPSDRESSPSTDMCWHESCCKRVTEGWFLIARCLPGLGVTQ